MAKKGFRATMASARVITGVFPKFPNFMIELVKERFPDLLHMGALTIISNIYGNPAVSIPAGLVDGLPVGMQVLARHHEDALLFDVALAVERERPWPLVATPVSAANAPIA